MANVNAPFGASPVKYLSGGPYNGPGNVYSTASGDGTALYVGDFVKLAGTGQTISGVTYADVTKAASGDVMVGVVTSVIPATADSTVYRAASTATLVEVCDDPNVLFAIQEANSGTALTANDLGLNINFTYAAGSTVTGISATVLDNASEDTTNTLDLKLVGFQNTPGNTVGSVAAIWLVRINRHQYVDQIAGV